MSVAKKHHHPIYDAFYIFARQPTDENQSYTSISLQKVKDFKKSIYQMLDKEPRLALEDLILDHRKEKCTHEVHHYDSWEFEIKQMCSVFDCMLDLLGQADNSGERQTSAYRYTSLRFEQGSLEHLVQMFYTLMSRSRHMQSLAERGRFIAKILRCGLRIENDLFQIIMSQGASPNVYVRVRDGDLSKQETLLEQKLRWGACGLLPVLLHYGANVYYNQKHERADGEHGCALSQFLHLKEQKLLWDHDWKQIFHKSLQFGWTPFVHSIRSCKHGPEQFQFFFDKIHQSESDAMRALLTQTDKFGTTPLMHLAMQLEEDRIHYYSQDDTKEQRLSTSDCFVRVLNAYSVKSINQRNKFGLTALVCLWWNGTTFINSDMNSNSIYYWDYSTHRSFSQTATLKIAKMLLSYGAEVTDADLGLIRRMCVPVYYCPDSRLDCPEDSKEWIAFVNDSYRSAQLKAYQALKVEIANMAKTSN
jgi:hypothetical protein